MDTNWPCVSIGLPIFNGEDYVEEAIDSILAQTYQNFQLIISDNGSTDRTAQICSAYVAKDHRVSYHRSDQNRGAAWNYNRVFRLATGKYFKWHAHDDKCAPELLERCVEALETAPDVVLCYAQTSPIDEQGQHVAQHNSSLDLRSPLARVRYAELHERFRVGGFWDPIFGVIRTNVLAQTPLIGSFPSSDTVLLAELSLWGKIQEIPEPLFYRRLHAQSSARIYPTFKERMAWFDPAKVGSVPKLGWNWFFFNQYCSAVTRVPLSLHERLGCYLVLGRWLLQNRGPLGTDFYWLIWRSFARSMPLKFLRANLRSVAKR